MSCGRSVLTGFAALGVLPASAELQNAAFMSETVASSGYSATWAAPRAVNEVIGNEGWHSFVGQADPWWRADIEALIPVDRIILHARDGFIPRLDGCIVVLFQSPDATGVPGPMWSPQYAHVNVTNGVTRINDRDVDGLTAPVPTEFSVISLVTAGKVLANTLVKDRNITATSRCWDGDIAEFVLCRRALSSEEEMVGRYLATRHGIASGYAQPGTLLLVR